jgi:hypothetical protein
MTTASSAGTLRKRVRRKVSHRGPARLKTAILPPSPYPMERLFVLARDRSNGGTLDRVLL